MLRRRQWACCVGEWRRRARRPAPRSNARSRRSSARLLGGARHVTLQLLTRDHKHQPAVSKAFLTQAGPNERAVAAARVLGCGFLQDVQRHVALCMRRSWREHRCLRGAVLPDQLFLVLGPPPGERRWAARHRDGTLSQKKRNCSNSLRRTAERSYSTVLYVSSGNYRNANQVTTESGHADRHSGRLADTDTRQARPVGRTAPRRHGHRHRALHWRQTDRGGPPTS